MFISLYIYTYIYLFVLCNVRTYVVLNGECHVVVGCACTTCIKASLQYTVARVVSHAQPGAMPLLREMALSARVRPRPSRLGALYMRIASRASAG